jgi:XTP/dITP diphosphohydrolase
MPDTAKFQKAEGKKMSYIVIASANSHKVEEYRELLKDQDVDLHSLADYPGFPGVEENGTSFTENASIKAVAVCKYCDVPAFADDSGLEVEALDGRPGIYSARYAENDPARRAKLLAELEGIPAEKRTARFRCCMALVIPGGEEIVVSGAWEGNIGFERAGSNGFGYDPLFIDPELELTGAELTREAKMVRSHRGKALAKLLSEVEERGL